ncbi:hypothetical protein HV213_17240 [Klebsiella sp. RHBSTW-00484]|uniref:hypothetical protein n=1 Tax=unclassified Klebsiella TaxID=2608929 RepID=UPI0015E55C25|nr:MULTISPECIES: hypothetical protein [unclassified Klebsiella]MBA7846682.1 hypothetical protein [Klebsiella sp. RHBSTW-00465]QLO34324.1 hypothetical protein HV213_17240 [Klebsiella sp. RHBSTW-00484]QLT73838.1 hypothetical protein HV204_17240 [Klebsiella sp. RHBSTW-00464]
MQRDLGAAETLGIRPDDVMVIIQFNTADEWYDCAAPNAGQVELLLTAQGH